MSKDQSKPVDLGTAEKLADFETEQVKQHEAGVAKVRTEIEALLVDHDITIGEWFDIVQSINERNDTVVPDLTIKEVKERYEYTR